MRIEIQLKSFKNFERIDIVVEIGSNRLIESRIDRYVNLD